MLNYKDLIESVKDPKKVNEELSGFFNKKNFLEYQIGENVNKDQLKAIKIMFESKKDLKQRIDDAFDYDPFCKEAFYAYMMTVEEIYLQIRFNAYLKEVNGFASFNDYQKECYLTILSFYVDFLIDIDNITGAIRMEKLYLQLSKNTNKNEISRLAFMYHAIENDEDFYRLYLESKFDLYDYLLLIVTLLKHEEEMKAREVLVDMFDNIKYGTYLDHVWDLDENDPEQKEFARVVDDCYRDLTSIPTFFSWVNMTREKYGK